MSKLYSYCKMRYDAGAWGEAELQQAVDKGYITDEEKQLIQDGGTTV